MQHHKFGKSSEMVSFAGYDLENQLLYLTFIGGPTTIAYRNVSPALYEELIASAYPDVCIRFKVQARHSFRRVEPAYGSFEYTFMK